ncbi:MAG: hypothetical protein KDE31_38355 [Caldilineaceae bacterium]|nr:hypothetical protein [Caldilineaceae bacterium]
MLDLLSEHIGQRVCVWFEKRLAVGILRGVGDGMLCVDITDKGGEIVRSFIALSCVTAVRTLEAQAKL